MNENHDILTGVILNDAFLGSASDDDCNKKYQDIGRVLAHAFGEDHVHVNLGYGIVSAYSVSVSDVKEVLKVAGIENGADILDLSAP